MGAPLTPDLFGTESPAKKSRGSRRSESGSRANKVTKNRQRGPRERAATAQLADIDAIAPAGTRVLGLDLGLRFGYALLDERGRRLSSGTLRFDSYPPSAPGLRASQVDSRVGYLFATLKPTHVAYEVVDGHTDGAILAAHVWGGLQWTVFRACHRLGITPETVHVAAVKRCATGAGGGSRADKAAVMAAANVRWFTAPDGVGDDNEADSLWIAEVMRRRVAAR